MPFEMTNVFIDNSALRALPFNREFHLLLRASEEGRISLSVSDIALFERARQFYTDQAASPLSTVELIAERYHLSSNEILRCYYLMFQELFKHHNATIVEISSTIQDLASSVIADTTTYFTDTNSNDQRDALIYASAVITLDPADTVILVQDRNLLEAFRQSGFRVENDPKKFVRSVSKGIALHAPLRVNKAQFAVDRSNIQLPEALHNALIRLDPTYVELATAASEQRALTHEPRSHEDIAAALQHVADLGEQDHEIRLEILSIVSWFSPISHPDLIELMAVPNEPVVEININRLIEDGSIKQIGNQYIPGDDGTCIAIGESRQDRLVALLRGN